MSELESLLWPLLICPFFTLLLVLISISLKLHLSVTFDLGLSSEVTIISSGFLSSLGSFRLPERVNELRFKAGVCCTFGVVGASSILLAFSKYLAAINPVLPLNRV